VVRAVGEKLNAGTQMRRAIWILQDISAEECRKKPCNARITPREPGARTHPRGYGQTNEALLHKR